ncbi:hypothetical protein FACS1894158_06760 [Betaproteobacteria bacterium]|nr:hypothetical protein FACS1894158_06760 [Betaproteobacteria bacterium]
MSEHKQAQTYPPEEEMKQKLYPLIQKYIEMLEVSGDRGPNIGIDERRVRMDDRAEEYTAM